MKKSITTVIVTLGLLAPSAAFAHHPPKPHKPKPPAPPVVVPPVVTPPVNGSQSRTGYCDQNGKFWDLVVGQTIPGLTLRPANVGLPGNPNALWC